MPASPDFERDINRLDQLLHHIIEATSGDTQAQAAEAHALIHELAWMVANSSSSQRC